MIVETLTVSAGPQGVLDPGKFVKVSDALGKHLIEIGAARVAPEGAKVNAEWPHATEVPAGETTTAHRAGEKR